MKILLATLLACSLLSACTKKSADPSIDKTWYPSPTNRLQLIVPSMYGPAQDSIAILFRNPEQVKVRYRFQVRKYTGPNFIQIANDSTRLLVPGEKQQINYHTPPSQRYVYGQDAIHVVLSNAATKEMYGDFTLTN